MTISVSEPKPFTTLPPLASLTVTCPFESVPEVILFTEYNKSSVLDSAINSIALKVASTGPPPSAFAFFNSPSTEISISAKGFFVYQ